MQATRDAADSGETVLYRAVSEAEYAQLITTGRFEVVSQSVEGKYFAEHPEHAATWGDAFYGRGQYRIVEVRLPSEVASAFHWWAELDGIGPARFAALEQLANVRMKVRGFKND
jgi:hypothetical protein